MKSMTPRERAEALVKQLSPRQFPFARKDRQQDVDMIESALKAQRAEECEALMRHVNKLDVWGDGKLIVRKYLCNWLDARVKEWRG